MDTTNQWTQQEECSSRSAAVGIMERKVTSRPRKDQALNCPRCQSTNTKFCYYNNYSLTQPRYFCKTCRRYWTEGGTLRNVPVGGGSRKSKIRSSSSCSSSTHKINIPDDHHHLINIPTTTNLSHHEFPSRNPNYYYYKILHESAAAGQDLNLGFPSSYSQDYHHQHGRPSSSSSSTPPPPPSFAALEILRTTTTTTTGGGVGADLNNSFIIPTSTPAPAAGFSFHDLMKPTTVSFSRYGGGTADDQLMIQENGAGRLMFPFGGAMKQVSGGGSTTTEADQSSNGYNWNGMLSRSGPW